MSRALHVSVFVLGLVVCSYAALAQDGSPTDFPAALPAPAASTAPGMPAVSPVMQSAVEKSRIAIEQCRERRLRKELKSYLESAQCSDPKIFAAWQEANYPHMDLVTAWLNAREEASQKVDQHLITPKQFDEQMDALTARLTAEEKRRRSGLLSVAGTDLQLQLPPPAQVVGVATPPGQEKLQAKKSAAARERAAASASDRASDTGSVGSLAAVSSLDSRTPKAQAGIGGPFVPVNPNSPAARAALARAAAAAAPGEGSSGLYAQLASQRSEAEARLVFRALQAQYSTVLGGRNAVIRRADDASQGTYYRVEIGPLTAGQANELCDGLKAAGAQCVPRYE